MGSSAEMLGLQLTKQQSDAVDAVAAWHANAVGCRTFRDDREQVFRLYGYAGTGKSSCALEFARACGGSVIFCAFTGKAAHVMRTKGCAGAQTIHSLIYLPRGKSEQRLEMLRKRLQELIEKGETGARVDDVRQAIAAEERLVNRPSFTLNPESAAADASLIVVDECSMVGETLARDLLSFRRPVLVLGDPAQLPPVRDCGYFTNVRPDMMLTEVHRHALDSPVYRMATAVRKGQPLGFWSDGESGVFDKRALTLHHLVKCDQVLVGKNETRHGQNAKMRRHLGRGQSLYPVTGDKLICLRNERESGFLNGQTWECAADAAVVDQSDVDTRKRTAPRVEMAVRVPGSGDPDDVYPVTAWASIFEGGEAPAGRSRLSASEFGYGYAMTVHKAQGSQWPDVLVCDESGVFSRSGAEAVRQWLYTGITRAARSVRVYRSGE